jgi:uncharacterized sulfatase
MILTVRFYELFITSTFSNYPAGSDTYLLIGFKFDLILFFRICATLMIPFLIIAHFSQKAARYFFIIISLILILGDMLLIKYFSAARVPLGADLLGYTFKEMTHTVGASGKFNILPYLVILAYLVIMTRVFIHHVYFRLKPWIIATLTILILITALPLKPFRINPSKFDNEFCMFVAANKLNFFIQSLADRYIHQGSQRGIKMTAKPKSTNRDGNPFKFINADYPFLHEETTPDVLGAYFKTGNTPPNIVFIIVESLGRAYCGEGAYLGSFTPFLDSLMNESLYWANCLSTSGRTFQALPSILGSLPFGDHGFANMGDKMPDHISLVSLLKKQADYTTTFVYGGEAEFDDMSMFLNRQKVDQIIDIKQFGPGYIKLPATGNGFTWGYGDREIFSRYLQSLTSGTDSRRIDILLTLAMHDPFNIPDQDYYIQKTVERLKSLKLSEKTKAFDSQFTRQLSTVTYLDESMRYLFSELKKSDTFENTIFIITGDHRMPEIPISTQIDRFHVPLIIYSPLLKITEKFPAVVSHFDIAPSLVAFLDDRGYISRPTSAAWIGHGLDISKSFRSINTYPFMRNINEMLDLIGGPYFLSNKTLYRINSNMDIEPIDDDDQLNELNGELNYFIRQNNIACRNNKLIPDSLKIFK